MIFWNFLHIRGQRFLWKLTKLFLARSLPETCPKHLKWCCWRNLRYFELFRGKKIFFYFHNFLNFFCIPGVRDFCENWPSYFFERSWPETCLKHLKWCCWRKLRYFKLFRGRKNFFYFHDFLDFFAYRGSEIFVKIDQVLFWEILAWNLSKTSQMVLLT